MGPPDRMTDHWWWRPGVRPGRRLYVWHILVRDRPKVTEVVRVCQERLAGFPGLDPVPLRWLHMTTQVVGFADEIGDDEVADLTEAARRRLRDVEPVTVELGRLLFHTEAVVLGIRPAGALDPVREGVRETVARTVRAHRLADEPGWTPHLAVAYSNRKAPAAPVYEALRLVPEPIPVRIGAVHLVRQERVGRLYRWDPVAAVSLGARTPG